MNFTNDFIAVAQEMQKEKEEITIARLEERMAQYEQQRLFLWARMKADEPLLQKTIDQVIARREGGERKEIQEQPLFTPLRMLVQRHGFKGGLLRPKVPTYKYFTCTNPECRKSILTWYAWRCSWCHNVQTYEHYVTDKCCHCQRELETIFCDYCGKELRL